MTSDVADRRLRLVGGEEVYQLGQRPESLSERVRRLQREAQVLACEEVDQLRATLEQAVAQASAIASSPDLFSSGVREQARRLADALPQTLHTLQALSERRLAELMDEAAPPVWRRS